MKTSALALAAAVLVLFGSSPLQPKQLLFEDFSYTNKQELKKNGWIVRTEPGWPGVPGAKWLDENVSLLKDPGQANNRILRLTSSTEGTPANTTQTQICHQRKYREGTYAARVRFTDSPVSGPDGLRHNVGDLQPGTELEERQRLPNLPWPSGRLACVGDSGA
jgi:hypothetical protein